MCVLIEVYVYVIEVYVAIGELHAQVDNPRPEHLKHKICVLEERVLAVTNFNNEHVNHLQAHVQDLEESVRALYKSPKKKRETAAADGFEKAKRDLERLKSEHAALLKELHTIKGRAEATRIKGRAEATREGRVEARLEGRGELDTKLDTRAPRTLELQHSKLGPRKHGGGVNGVALVVGELLNSMNKNKSSAEAGEDTGIQDSKDAVIQDSKDGVINVDHPCPQPRNSPKSPAASGRKRRVGKRRLCDRLSIACAASIPCTAPSMPEQHLKGARESSSLKEESKPKMGGGAGSSSGLEEKWLEANQLPANEESKELAANEESLQGNEEEECLGADEEEECLGAKHLPANELREHNDVDALAVWPVDALAVWLASVRRGHFKLGDKVPDKWREGLHYSRHPTHVFALGETVVAMRSNGQRTLAKVDNVKDGGSVELVVGDGLLKVVRSTAVGKLAKPLDDFVRDSTHRHRNLPNSKPPTPHVSLPLSLSLSLSLSQTHTHTTHTRTHSLSLARALSLSFSLINATTTHTHTHIHSCYLKGIDPQLNASIPAIAAHTYIHTYLHTYI
jgi:hypothetical protein